MIFERQKSVVIKIMDSGARLPEFMSPLHHLLAVCLGQTT